MILHARSRSSDVALLTPRHPWLLPQQTQLEPETERLLRRHLGFFRGWGRGWAWRDRRGVAPVASGRTAVSEMGPGGTILELGASVAAARHLAARHRAGGVAILPHDGQETPFSVLLPPTMVTCSEDVSGCIARLLAARGQVPERLLFAACTLLAEAAQNVCEHSGSVGCVAAHWSAGSGAGELGIGIADRGIGIPRSLMPRFRERDLAAPGPERAIVAALRLDDWSGRSRGAGLCMSRRLLGRHGGVLHVRSGGAVVSVGPGDLVLASRSPGRLAAVCGTQIAIYLGGGDGCSVVDTECNSA